MDSFEKILPNSLERMGILEPFKLNTLVHHWKDVVGPVFANHTRIIDIKPPQIVISADTSQWMQEIKMNQKRILSAINEFYGSQIITDMRLIMNRQSYVKESSNNTLNLVDMPDVDAYFDSSKIAISDEDVKRVDHMVNRIDNESLKQAFKVLLINGRKKEIHLEQQGYHRCKRCGIYMKRPTKYCISCDYELHREHIKTIKSYLKSYPYATYGQCQRFVPCSFNDFATAMREMIYFYLDKIYKGSVSRNHMYMAAMLITHKRPEELTDQHVINLCNKYRSKFLSKEL